MNKDTDMVTLKRLIDIGKDKGYITYEELNDDLSDEMVSSEEDIDDIMMMFEELDIMVIDEASKEEMEKAKKIKKKQAKSEERDNYRVDISEAGSRASDPVKMYLKEMGCISLLTREGEVEIAKRIEAGEKETLNALLACSVGIEHIIELGKELAEGEAKLKDVINDLEDEDNYTQLGERKESLLTLISEIKCLYDDSCRARREMIKADGQEADKKRLDLAAKEKHARIVELVNSFRLEKRQLERMVKRLEGIVAELEEAERVVTDCMLQAGGKPISYLKKCFAKLPRVEGDDEIIPPVGLKKCHLVALKEKVEGAQSIIKRAKERTNLTPRQLKRTLERIEASLEKAKEAKGAGNAAHRG